MIVHDGVQNEAKQEQDRGGEQDRQGDGQSSDQADIQNDMKNLDELLSFINGTDAGKGDTHQPSSKAAKRARQKQRKVIIFSSITSNVFGFEYFYIS